MMWIILSAFVGLIGIFCFNTWVAVQALGKMEIELDFCMDEFVSEMYEGHRYGRDD